MFSNVYLKNIEGITEVNLNFVTKSRTKESLNTALETKDGIFINRQLAIIGPNASGKTSTLKAISNISSFIILPVFLNKIMFKLSDKIEDAEVLKDAIYQMTKVKRNVNARNEESIFSIEIYIDTDDEETTGYYEYILKFTGELFDKEIDYEELNFRSKYNSKKKLEISKKEKIKNSQVGYIYTFLNNFDEKNVNFKYIKTFGDYIVKNIDSDFFDTDDDSLVKDFLKNEPEKARMIINLVDPEIVDIRHKKIDRLLRNKNLKFTFITKTGNELEYEQLLKGTKKILIVISKVLTSLENNMVILIDEIESNINKKMVDIIFKLFYSRKSKSQIIFTSNYPSIIPDNFKNDQIYILKRINGKISAQRVIDYKNSDGKKLRQDVSFSRAYFAGKLDDKKEVIENEKRIDEILKKL